LLAPGSRDRVDGAHDALCFGSTCSGKGPHAVQVQQPSRKDQPAASGTMCCPGDPW
jgi:hypothetical protein